MASIGEQIFRINSGALERSSHAVHLRHNDQAHIAFFDGHVETASLERLGKLGFTSVLDESLKTIDTSE